MNRRDFTRVIAGGSLSLSLSRVAFGALAPISGAHTVKQQGSGTTMQTAGIDTLTAPATLLVAGVVGNWPDTDFNTTTPDNAVGNVNAGLWTFANRYITCDGNLYVIRLAYAYGALLLSTDHRMNFVMPSVAFITGFFAAFDGGGAFDSTAGQGAGSSPTANTVLIG